MMHRTVALFFAVLLPGALHGQLVTGQVTDEGTGVGLEDVGLQLRPLLLGGGAAVTVLTDEHGRFAFTRLRPGQYEFKVVRIGYGTQVSYLHVDAGDTVAIDIELGQEAIDLEPITVTASARPWYEHMKAPPLWEFYERMEYQTRLGQGRFLTGEKLDYIRGLRLSHAIATLPRWYATPARPGSGLFDLSYRGRCSPTYFLDGHLFRGDLDDVVFMGMVEGIEVYSGRHEVPGELMGASMPCAVVAVWSKRVFEEDPF